MDTKSEQEADQRFAHMTDLDLVVMRSRLIGGGTLPEDQEFLDSVNEEIKRRAQGGR